MPLVYACIAPHGGEIIPSLAGGSLKLFAPTRHGMKALAAQFKAAAPQTVVVATPHNLRLPKHLGVVISENTSGNMTEGDKKVSLKAKCDLVLAASIIARAEVKGLPVVGANYGALEGPSSDLAMDWGTFVPLWFFMRGAMPKPDVVIVTPARGIPLAQNFHFGKCIAEAAEAGTKRVALVASADQAHAHKKDGPYGYDPRAKEYDEAVQEAVKEQRLSAVMEFEKGMVDAAKPDSLWQLAVLAGALSVVPMEAKFESYQVPTYYGMLCAGYNRRRRPA
jgi:aromatic ring-opening dioxygenase LigB subunit